MPTIFEQAARLKLRFSTSQGQLSTEDLWDLPLTHTKQPHLDSIAITLAGKLNQATQLSFVDPKSTANDLLKLKFDIVKHIIDVKLQERKDKENEKQKHAKRELIMQIIESKQTEDLKGKSMEDLKKMLEEL